jgi:hypothetical protein
MVSFSCHPQEWTKFGERVFYILSAQRQNFQSQDAFVVCSHSLPLPLQPHAYLGTISIKIKVSFGLLDLYHSTVALYKFVSGACHSLSNAFISKLYSCSEMETCLAGTSAMSSPSGGNYRNSS